MEEKLTKVFEAFKLAADICLDIDPDEVNLESRLMTDLRIDEIDFVNISMEMEDELNVSIDDDMVSPFVNEKRDSTVSEFIETIYESVKDKL